MPKLKLKLDALAVESFSPVAGAGPEEGTVRAHCAQYPCNCTWQENCTIQANCTGPTVLGDSCEACTIYWVTCGCTYECSNGCPETGNYFCGPDVQY